MTLRFADGFDHYTTLGRKWNNNGNNYNFSGPAGTRFNIGKQINITYAGQWIQQDWDNRGTWIVGFAFYTSTRQFRLLQFVDGVTTQVLILIDTTGVFQVYKGVTGSPLGQSTFAIAQNAGIWQYIEVKVIIHSTLGAVKIRVGGKTVLDLTNINTQNTANPYAQHILFNDGNFGSSNCGFDDLYICDGSGTTNNDFLGDIRIDSLYPSGVGTTTQWTPSAGQNYAQVNSATQDDDTTYVEASGIGNQDTYQMGDLSSTPVNIYGVQPVQLARKTDVGSRTLQNVLRIGGVDYLGPTGALANAYGTPPFVSVNVASGIYEKSPATAVPFTASEINNLEAGYKLIL